MSKVISSSSLSSTSLPGLPHRFWNFKPLMDQILDQYTHTIGKSIILLCQEPALPNRSCVCYVDGDFSGQLEILDYDSC